MESYVEWPRWSPNSRNTTVKASELRRFTSRNRPTTRIPDTIVSDHDPSFTSNFGRKLTEYYGTKLLMSTVFTLRREEHPEGYRIHRTNPTDLNSTTNWLGRQNPLTELHWIEYKAQRDSSLNLLCHMPMIIGGINLIEKAKPGVRRL